MEKTLKEGQGCGHPGCLNHISHPCEGCGRVGGRKQDPLDAAIAFAKKNDMIVFMGDITVRVAYPNGEEKTFMRYEPNTPKEILDMTCRML